MHLRVAAVVSLAALSSLVAGTRAEADRGDDLPAKYKKPPYSLMSLSVGYPNAGYQLRPIKLKTNRNLRVKKGSEQRIYGHPALVKMLHRNARDMARTFKGSVMLVGDLSDEDGGPLSGHHSHQSGRDADVAFYALDPKGKPAKLDRFIAFDGEGVAKDKSGYRFDDRRNWLLVRAWLKDHRAGLSHIFVSRPLRRRLLAYAEGHKAEAKHVEAAARLLKEPKNADAHDDHFHLRISCPKRQEAICREEPR
ncbi:MAG: penicillin-insensitive murein endopeptidase [Polyangiaceae bacterium]